MTTSAWHDGERWLALREGSECPICLNARPLDIVAERETSWITAPVAAPLPGYVCVVSKQHAVEPFELSPAAQGAFFRDAMQVARTLSELFNPIKMNYQINGNTLPHLHMHLYPRLPDDPFVGAPIDGSATGFVRTAPELDAIKRALSPSSGAEKI